MERLFGPRPAKAPHPLAAANALLEEIAAAGQHANLVRLSRLLTICQCWSLTLRGEALHSGTTRVLLGTPTVDAIHAAFRRFGTGRIDAPAVHPDLPAFDFPADEDPARRKLMREVVRAYADVGDFRLGRILRERTPAGAEPRDASDAELRLVFADAARAAA